MLNLLNDLGCLMFIMCMGVDNLVDNLLCLLCKVKVEGCYVVWSFDLMYGNIFLVFSGYKMCNFDLILCEIK